MKKTTKWILITSIAILLVSVWTWRYVSLNEYWESTIPKEYSETVFSIGETVVFGEDIFLPEGYALCVNSIDLQDYPEFLAENQITLENEQSRPPAKLALVNITLSNIGEKEEGISLLEFSLHGLDEYFSFNAELLAAINPVLQGNVGIILRPGESYDFVLVYEIRDEYLSHYTREHFDTYELYLTTTVYPSKQEIKVQ